MRHVIRASDAPKAIGPYSQAIMTEQFIFLSAQMPLDPQTGELIAGGIEEQTQRVLGNIQAILEAAGSSMNLVVKTTVFLTDLDDFAAMNSVYAKHFPNDPPARSTVQVAALPKGASVAIEAIALR